MKIVVISDSHGHIANLQHVLGFAQKIKAGAVVHCGDWDNLKVVKTALAAKIPLYAVKGNADIDARISFPEVSKFRLGARKIGVVHSLALVLKLLAVEVIFCGHRHFRQEKTVKGVKIISPGALSGARPSFAVYDTVANEVEFFNLENE